MIREHLGTIGKAACGLALLSLLSGCIGVKLTAQGAMVRQGTAESVAGCELVGKVSSAIPSKTLNKLAPGKIQEQLIVLARNEAVSFGGNVIVPTTTVQDGAQDFNVFRCR
ncbi:MAG: DUF4156 domain-containing protein [Pseudomonadales bacterium]|jgi:hypothetical protein